MVIVKSAKRHWTLGEAEVKRLTVPSALTVSSPKRKTSVDKGTDGERNVSASTASAVVASISLITSTWTSETLPPWMGCPGLRLLLRSLGSPSLTGEFTVLLTKRLNPPGSPSSLADSSPVVGKLDGTRLGSVRCRGLRARAISAGPTEELVPKRPSIAFHSGGASQRGKQGL